MAIGEGAIGSLDDLHRALTGDAVGQIWEITVIRDGRLQRCAVQVGERSAGRSG